MNWWKYLMITELFVASRHNNIRCGIDWYSFCLFHKERQITPSSSYIDIRIANIYSIDIVCCYFLICWWRAVKNINIVSETDDSRYLQFEIRVSIHQLRIYLGFNNANSLLPKQRLKQFISRYAHNETKNLEGPYNMQLLGIHPWFFVYLHNDAQRSK